MRHAEIQFQTSIAHAKMTTRGARAKPAPIIDECGNVTTATLRLSAPTRCPGFRALAIAVSMATVQRYVVNECRTCVYTIVMRMQTALISRLVFSVVAHIDLVTMELLALILTSVRPCIATRKVQFMFLNIASKIWILIFFLLQLIHFKQSQF